MANLPAAALEIVPFSFPFPFTYRIQYYLTSLPYLSNLTIHYLTTTLPLYLTASDGATHTPILPRGHPTNLVKPNLMPNLPERWYLIWRMNYSVH